jgi:mannitol-1-phosphate/altronate dehydrogenase
MAGYYYNLWKSNSVSMIVREVLENNTLWGEDLILLPGFENEVTRYLNLICENGMAYFLENFLLKEVMDRKKS